MSTKRVCDRCGKEFATFEIKHIVKVSVFELCYGKMDLCWLCKNELLRFLGGAKIADEEGGKYGE